MVCKSCKKKLSNLDIYCLSCGVPAESFKEHFGIKKIIGLAKDACRADKTNNFIYIIPVALVLIAFVYVVENGFIGDSYWVNYIAMNGFMVFYVPLLILAFGGGNTSQPPPNPSSLEGRKTIGNRPYWWVFAFKKYYLKLVMFVFLVVFYFFALRVICQGDGMLNLVRLVMVCWGIAIVFPVPFLIFTRDESVFASLKRAYIAGKYLRWHQFCLSVVMAFVLLVSVILVLIPLPYGMRFSGHLMRIWYEKQDEFSLYDKGRDY